MAAAAMLVSGHQAIFDAMHEFVFKVANFFQFDEIWSNNEGTASVFLISRWGQTPCWILTTRCFSTPWMIFYSNSQHSYQIC